MNKIKKVLLTIGTVAAVTALSSCGLSDPQTPEPPKYPDYRTIQLGDELWEVRFTDSEGNKMRCFVYDGYNAGGLDACEKVG